MDDGLVMVVRHGTGRRRHSGYLDPVFARLAERSPACFECLRFHMTGDPQPSLDGVRTVVFLLADPLRERYPDCYDEAAALAASARERGARIVNSPEALSHTIKSTQASLWRAAEIPTPETVRFESREELASLAERLGYPVLIRADVLHAQQGIRVCASPRDLDAVPEGELLLPGAVGPLVDVRESYRAIDPRNLYARLFHKKRLLVLGDRIRTKHVFFSTQPIVTSGTSTFASRLGFWLGWLGPTFRNCAREDLAYWRRISEHAGLMRRAVAALGLDFAAIDYSSHADGSVVLWEANPYPQLPEKRDMMLGSWRRAEDRVASYRDAVAGSSSTWSRRRDGAAAALHERTARRSQRPSLPGGRGECCRIRCSRTSSLLLASDVDRIDPHELRTHRSRAAWARALRRRTSVTDVDERDSPKGGRVTAGARHPRLPG